MAGDEFPNNSGSFKFAFLRFGFFFPISAEGY
jgi:hypothetical protein